MVETRMVWTLGLRVLALVAVLSAAVTMATGQQDFIFNNTGNNGSDINISSLGNAIKVSYGCFTALGYFVAANGIVCVYSLLVLFLPSESLLWRLVVFFDAVMTMLLASGVSSAFAVNSSIRFGNPLLGWQPICGQVPTFCGHVVGALVVCCVGLVLYFILFTYTVHHVLNPFLLQGV